MASRHPVQHAARAAALGALWERWADIGAELTEAQWLLPTRCTGWDIRAVYAHHSMLPMVLATAAPPAAATGTAGLTAARVLLRFNEPDGVAHTMKEGVASLAVAQAAGGTDALVDRFRDKAPEALAKLSRLDPEQVVVWATPDTPIAVHELVRIVVMEATVHLLDVYDALRRPCEVEESILAHTVQLLAEMTPSVQFIEAATGRTAHSPLPVLR